MNEQTIQEAADYIQSVAGGFTPEYGIILGTGLGSLINDVEAYHEIAYENIPNFPLATVEFHTGKLILGKLEGKNVVVMQGRFHYYEGYSMKEITLPVRVMKLLGIRKLLVSNAAGGINLNYELGDLMVVEDHINLHSENPLTGANLDSFGPRFVDMSEPYSKEMIRQAMTFAEQYNIRAHEGVYVSVPGPNLETRAEYRYLKTIGADAVGMSTTPEIIVARHMGLPCFAISVITDICDPDNLEPVDIDKIINAAKSAEPDMTRITRHLISEGN